MQKTISSMILLGLLLYLPGCGSGSAVESFMREGESLAHIQTIAVLPYENLGGGGEKRIREITMTQVLA